MFDGIEVNGRSILGVINSMGIFADTGRDILKFHGIIDPVENSWYPLQSWLDSFATIEKKIGPVTLKRIGREIALKAIVPPKTTMEQALRSVDCVYHLQHRKDGKIMYDVASNTMLDGIGNYVFEKVEDNFIRLTSDSPYPCIFDLGGLEGVATRFKPKGVLMVTADHAPGTKCKHEGGKACIYEIRW